MHRMTNKAPEPYGDLDFACVVNPQRLVWILSGDCQRKSHGGGGGGKFNESIIEKGISALILGDSTPNACFRPSIKQIMCGINVSQRCANLLKVLWWLLKHRVFAMLLNNNTSLVF
jgi:hypothetical protein